MEKMKVGVTGGTGFIGQALIQEYAHIYDFRVVTSRADTAGLAPFAEYVRLPYDREGFKAAFQGCDAVVHLGGTVMHGLDNTVSMRPYLENISLAESVFSLCSEMSIKNVINASSVAVYDQIGETPVRESDPLQPNSAYGIAKIAVEKLAELYNRKYGMMIKSLRFGQGLGYQKHMEPGRFWTILLENSLRGEPIPVWGSGLTGRDVIYVKDMACAVHAALQCPESSGCYNIGTGHICTNLELAETYCRVFSNPGGIKFIPTERESMIRTCMDCSKADRELHFKARYGVQEMIEDLKREYERNAGN